MNYPKTSTASASILCVGMGWFPNHPGGLNRYLYELTHQLAHQDQIEICGIDLPQLASDYPIALTNLATSETSILHQICSTRKQFLQRQLKSLDAINLHFALYSFPLLTALPKNVPITFNFHGPWSLESQLEGYPWWNVRLKHWLEQQVCSRCDRFIVLSKAFGQILHQTYQVPWGKIHIIPPGVNLAQFQPHLSRQEARTKLNWHLDRKILFTPRRLVHRMGLSNLLNAIAQIKSKVPEVWLAIAGKGPLQPVLQQQIQELDLTNQVQLLGYISDEQLQIAYQAADLTIVPSQSLEGFGLVIPESLASGTPVLCTPIGGMPEAISPLCPELIATSTETSALTHHLIDLLTEQIHLPSRSACRTYAYERFNWQTNAQQVRKVLLGDV
jgi:glycosyltransferase involved in cell wall biosynthesis